MLGDGDDDDDDFQNPAQAVVLSQRIIVSSLRSGRSQFLGQSSGGRDWKKPRLSVAMGKENHSVSKNRILDVPKLQVKTVVEDGMNPCEKIRLPDARKLNIDVRYCEGGGINEPEFVPLASDVTKDKKNRSCGERKMERESHCFVSVESRLLASTMSALSPYSASVDSGVSRDSEIGAGLKDSCDLGELAAVRRTEAAGESEKFIESDDRGVCLGLMNSRLVGEWARSKLDIQDLRNFSGNGVELDKNGGPFVSSTAARLVEFTEKSNLPRDEEHSSEFGDDAEVETFKKTSKMELDCLRQVLSPTRFVENIDLVEKKENHCDMSGEDKILDSRIMLVPSAVEGNSLDGNGCDEFETGTQLNVLMDLCCDMGEKEGSRCRRFRFGQLGTRCTFRESERNLSCPLCESDITDLSEENRHIHTNDCLDKVEKHEKSEEFASVVHGKSSACQQFALGNPVLEWLSALGLGRYEEVFIREEIDWDALQWLTEEDLISIGIVTLGPRKKILHAISELRQRNYLADHGKNDAPNFAANEKTKIPRPGNKLITEYFRELVGNKTRCTNSNKLFHVVKKANDVQTRHSIASKRNANRGRAKDAPPWCRIPGTPFRVVEFVVLLLWWDTKGEGEGDNEEAGQIFIKVRRIITVITLLAKVFGIMRLKSMTSSIPMGLTKNFCHGKLYCSKITAVLVNMKIGVPWDRIQILPLNQKITIADVNLTCLEANHCPGSIIILFEPSNQKAILHTGDFRFSAEMAACSILQSSHIHTLILDTTYCSPQYDFPKQEEVIEFVIDAIRAEAFNPKTLFLIGTYTIGKEKLFLEVARTLRTKIYVGAGKFHVLKCLGFPEEDMKWFTTNEMESHIHVVPMWTIASFKRMKYISNQYSDRYNLIVAFSPTGWTSGKGKKKSPARRLQQGTIIRNGLIAVRVSSGEEDMKNPKKMYEVPYSEHCSFPELKDFVLFISPEKIIPSVNNEGPDSAKAMIDLLLPDS
ncbi:hypothetical protein HPP92_016228 [Vanilla planifolia]|uniref:SAM domain-containing protein n=1 Tax=Vanilla planifolia TaxID=51239 RepID=A0A835QDQ4_VANPL|nr:hypothetical protein HPP92_016228 [Vanilla planifolia]